MGMAAVLLILLATFGWVAWTEWQDRHPDGVLRWRMWVGAVQEAWQNGSSAETWPRRFWFRATAVLIAGFGVCLWASVVFFAVAAIVAEMN
jgi:hypothetical protein